MYITDQNHGYDDLDLPISRQAMPERPVRIGAGSWLGHGTVVLPGATIGRHVVVGANSVVRGEIPSYCVAAGNPARVVKQMTGRLTMTCRTSPGQCSVGEIVRWSAARHLVVAGELLELLADRDAVDGRLRERLVLAAAQADR